MKMLLLFRIRQKINIYDKFLVYILPTTQSWILEYTQFSHHHSRIFCHLTDVEPQFTAAFMSYFSDMISYNKNKNELKHISQFQMKCRCLTFVQEGRNDVALFDSYFIYVRNKIFPFIQIFCASCMTTTGTFVRFIVQIFIHIQQELRR